MGDPRADRTTDDEPVDPTMPSERWLWKRDTLREPTILQSFAFDEVNGHLYVLQVTEGGGEAGDLCLSRLAGAAYDDTANPPSGRGNTYVSRLDVRTGALVQRARTEAGYSLDHREPEGLAVRRAGGLRLCIGLASGERGARRFSLYCKPFSPPEPQSPDVV
ncbi:hypothetical protein [Streptomyces sp. 142MFCol3.1]|uniref:hypothetical protein n=1 Tax=Streptomyces sp. 142MFCol3.1 TaxID=1172179 RepID=UPI00040734F8|nr:hypothetical protein [Streptomyces sp. 142MFCol3.1]